jgi:proline iminopeptidase
MQTRNFWNLPAALIVATLLGCSAMPHLRSGEGKVMVKGGELWYRILGEGENTPLLMMHGGPGGTSRSFYHLAALADDRPIIIFDQLGSGKSTFHEDTALLKVNYFVAQVAALKSELGLKKYYLHGHSWGTALALEYYNAYPKGIEGIVFNSPYFSTAVWTADADTLIMSLPDSIQQAIATGELEGDFSAEAYQHANLVFAKQFGLRGERLTSPLDTGNAPFNEFIYNYMWGPTEFTATGTLKNYDNLSALGNVDVPVLFVTGEYDEARPATVKKFLMMAPNSQYAEIEGAGHATMHDNQKRNVAVIREFLNALDRE